MEVITKIHTYICIASSIPLVLVCSEQQLPATPRTAAAAEQLAMLSEQVPMQQEEANTPVTIEAAQQLMGIAGAKIVLSGDSYTCAICHSIIKGYQEFIKHKKTHKENLPYKCQRTGCDYATQWKNDLESHERTHLEEKPYKCSCVGCNYASKWKFAVTKHEKTHKSERPYKCLECGTSFVRLGDLRDHEKLHTKAMPHVCLVCGQGFTRPSHLKDHMNIHTKVKPYHCDKCEKKFAKKSNLTAHKKIIHPDAILTPGSQLAAQKLISLSDETDE
jgi:uncharacterized Zn-finger protein